MHDYSWEGQAFPMRHRSRGDPHIGYFKDLVQFCILDFHKETIQMEQVH